MEMWEKPPHNRGRNNPSFSSSLLDAIYRSIDESDGKGGAAKDHHTGGAPDPSLSTTRKFFTSTDTKRTLAAVSEKTVTRRKFSTSSSSSSSYSGGFSSSSDADSSYSSSIYCARPKPIKTGPVLTRSDRIRSDPPAEKKNPGSIKKKLRDLRKSTSPASPGARLAGFLNSLFTSAAGNPKKAKIVKEPSPCSSASSHSRSCLSKTPSSGGSTGRKRSVRFCPVGVIVGEDCRPCGEKFVFDGDFPLPAPARSRERKKIMEELLRGFELENDDDDGESDSSSDLFELENLSVIGRYRDELPVYETTNPGTNRAIAQGLLL